MFENRVLCSIEALRRINDFITSNKSYGSIYKKETGLKEFYDEPWRRKRQLMVEFKGIPFYFHNYNYINL